MACITSAARSFSTPTTIRSGRMKSSIAAPSRRELRVRGDIEICGRIGPGDHLLDPAVCSDRNGGFGHDHGVAGERLRDFLGRGHHVGQIRMTVAAPRRCADRDKHRRGAIDGFGQTSGEGQAPRVDVPRHQIVKAWFVDRNLSGLKPGQLGGVLFDADDIMSKIRKADPRDQSDVPRADHRDFHVSFILSVETPGMRREPAAPARRALCLYRAAPRYPRPISPGTGFRDRFVRCSTGLPRVFLT